MEYIIDCRQIDSRNELHRVLAATLEFPEWYGHNLDALYDLLTARRVDTHLIFENWNPSSPAFKGLKQVLADVEEHNPHLTVTFTG